MSTEIRKLASIQKVISVEPIPDADKIEKITILGWELVSKKGEFKVGDLCIYIEIDSIVPPHKVWDDFLAARKYRIKTIKLKKQISQGLALPISILKDFPDGDKVKIEEGVDVTDILGVKKWENESDREANTIVEHKAKRGPITRFLMKFAFIRKIHFWLYGKEKGSYPDFIVGGKTDEKNIAAFPNLLKELENEELYVSEKIEGQSMTAFVKTKNEGFWNKLFGGVEFGICSRTQWKQREDGSTWWKYAKDNDLKNKMLKIRNELKIDFAIQGELAGGKIQSNIYKFNKLRLFVFNVLDITNQREFTFDEMVDFCKKYGFETVPILDTFFSVKGKTVKELVEYSNGKSMLADVLREGVVIRSKNNPKSKSFKVKSPEYLLKNEQ